MAGGSSGGDLTAKDSELFTPRDIKILEKKLDRLMCAYSAAEGLFPAWEAAFALIIGQLLIACLGNYTSLQQISLLLPMVNRISLLIILMFLGLILSFFWLILVTLNLRYANILDTKIRACEEILGNAYQNKGKSKEDIKAIISGSAFIEYDDHPGLWNTVIGCKKGENFKIACSKMLTSTWFYRRLLPLISVIIWLTIILVRDL